MSAVVSQITSLTIVCPAVYSVADQRKHQSSASLAQRIHRWPVNSPHKWPVTRSFDVFFDLRLNKWLFPFDDVIMWLNVVHFQRLFCAYAENAETWIPTIFPKEQKGPHSASITFFVNIMQRTESQFQQQHTQNQCDENDQCNINHGQLSFNFTKWCFSQYFDHD